MASYSWARRLHMVRFARARPLSVVIAVAILSREEILRSPESLTFSIGTRSVIFSESNEITNNWSWKPAISCFSTPITLPTPCVGYTT